MNVRSTKRASVCLQTHLACVCAIRESELLLHDNAGSGRTEAVKLFLFNTCLLLCRRGVRPGKWDLRVLIRMNKAVRFEERAQLQFSITAKGRTFKFGAMERGEVRGWLKALEAAVADKREMPKPELDDPKIGGLLDGLKAGLSFDDDDGGAGADDDFAPRSSTGSSGRSKPAAPRAPSDDEGGNNDGDDDDDPFAAIAKRPSTGQKRAPAAAAAAAPAAQSSNNGGGDLLSLFDDPPPQQSGGAAAPASNNAFSQQPQQPMTNSFDDFFGGPSTSTPAQQPQQQFQQQPQQPQSNPLSPDMLAQLYAQSAPANNNQFGGGQAPMQPTQPSGPNYSINLNAPAPQQNAPNMMMGGNFQQQPQSQFGNAMAPPQHQQQQFFQQQQQQQQQPPPQQQANDPFAGLF